MLRDAMSMLMWSWNGSGAAMNEEGKADLVEIVVAAILFIAIALIVFWLAPFEA